MSIKAISWAFEQDTPPTTKLVLLKLADNANDDGYCWPSQSTIARHTGLNRSTVNRHIKKLADAGLVEVIPRSKDGVSLPNHYQLHIEWGSCKEKGVGAESHRGGRRESQGVVAEEHTEPSVESSKGTNGAFERFWKAYPVKRNKKKAKDAWQRKCLNDKADELIADVETRTKKDPQWLKGYIPHATTYINGERWEDEIETSEQGGEPKSPARRMLN
jgi:DNA-binding transcriptional ArsR family regulator